MDDGPAIQDTCETFLEATTRILLSDAILQSTTVQDVTFLEKSFKNDFFGTWIDV